MSFYFLCSKKFISRVVFTQKQRFIHVFMHSFILDESIEYLFNQSNIDLFNLNLEQDKMPGTEKDGVKM